MVSIRPEELGDVEAVRAVNERAFGQPDEANIVDRLRGSCRSLISLLAVRESSIVGHILFSPATIDNKGTAIEGMALAPMAVRPEYQRQGIGSALVESGLTMLRDRSCPFVIVLGHPQYYPRFGFAPASSHGIECQWPGVPDEAFMALILDEFIMGRVYGMTKYRDEFDQAP